jgi:pimeloyl-ACP methyl ester carboxylesterase
LKRAPDERADIGAGGFDLRASFWNAQHSDAPPLLFLNGIAADNRLAGALLSRIEGRMRITIDMPGIGGTPDRLYPYSIADVAVAVAGMMAQLGHDQFDVAGFSWGGAVAQQLALADASPVRRMVLMATTPVMPAPGLGAAALLDADVLTSGVRLTGTSLIGIGAQLLAASGWSVVGALPRLAKVPTLVLGARGDMVVPIAYAQWLARLIPGARLELVDGAHLFAFRQAEKVGPMIAAFLDAG